VYDHLILKPFLKGYTMCLLHDERRGVNEADETCVMSQKDNEIIPANIRRYYSFTFRTS